MTVITGPIPRVKLADRTTTELAAPNTLRVNAHYGFMRTPNVPAVLNAIDYELVEYVPDEMTFFVGRQSGQVTSTKGMATCRKHLYVFMTRNAEDPIKHYQLPADRILERGVRYRL